MVQGRAFRGNPVHLPPLLVPSRRLLQSLKHQPKELKRLFRGNPVQHQLLKALFSEKESIP